MSAPHAFPFLRRLRRALLASGLLAVATGAGAQAVEPAPVASKSPDAIIHPAEAPRAEVAVAPSNSGGGFGAVTLVGALALAAGGFWLAKRGRMPGMGARDLRHLSVEETRPLGNRQFLIVAAYDDKRFLIGVCPGRIEFLTALDGGAPRREPPAS